VYLSRSTNGGTSWTDFRVTEHRFYPRPVNGTQGNMGDNIGITSGNGKLYPVWMSNQGSAVFQVWSAIIDYSTIGIQQIGSEIPSTFELKQNYPNPFNPSTKIGFKIPKSWFVSLKIYDITGKEVQALLEQSLNAGEYSVDWNAGNLPSGIYIYSMQAGSFTQSRKMILVK
jgi:hypothetical protein